MINRRTFTLTALASLIPTSVALGQISPWKIGDVVRLPALTQLNGQPVDWGALKGKVIVLEFWGSWCPFCSRQNPVLDRFYKANQARGLEVITISLDKTKDAAQEYMKKGGYSFKAGMVTPEWDVIYKQRRGLPQLFVIDRQGRLAMVEVREMLEDELLEIARFL
jgi:thiol-disulfide isomerase/thioredoxin